MKVSLITESIVCAVACIAFALPSFGAPPKTTEASAKTTAASAKTSAAPTKTTATPSKTTAAPAKINAIPAKGFSGELTEIAKSNNQWTGIAVSKRNRVFVCFPRWGNAVPVSAGELLPDGSVTPFPDKKWNEWIQGSALTGSEFICVQSVYCDSTGALWILDPAAPRFQGPVTDGPKLVKVNLASGRAEKTYPLATVAPKDSYLNDVRIDTKRQIAYMTDSGLGAIVVLDLRTGNARRLLDKSETTKAENIWITIDGKRWGVQRDGSVRKVHSDGIALDKTGDNLYYQALTGKTLYRVATKDLRNEKLSADDLHKKVEKFATTCVADGIEFGGDGKLYITSLEDNAIKRMSVTDGKKNLETVIQDKQLIWPDSLAMRADGYIYVTCSQIHLGPKPPTPYKVFRFKPKN
jgi:sugar lactone lactonase YvrE